MQKPASMTQSEYSGLTKSEKRQLADPLGRDRLIEIEGRPQLEVKYNQAEYKVSKHGSDHGLPTDTRGKTPKTEANTLAFMKSIANMANRENTVWYTDGQYQGGTKRGINCINLYDRDTGVITIYQKQTDGSNLFLTTCELTPIEREHLEATNGNFVTEGVLKKQNIVNVNIENSIDKNNEL